MNRRLSITIGWLYPDLMSTYGDRGNIICLEKRAKWRGIDISIAPINQESNETVFANIDLLFGGGSQDREQAIVMRDLHGKKAQKIKSYIESGKPALFVCGSPQLMGKYYEPAAGEKIRGLAIFDMVSKSPKSGSRLVGNVAAAITGLPELTGTIVGFENHGGRTWLGKKVKPLAKILVGHGNNGEDGTEGVVYKNSIGCYFHGPLLPKNPNIADWLIAKALEVKYGRKIILAKLDDDLEWHAHSAMLKRLGADFK